jgi:hypothetical protein
MIRFRDLTRLGKAAVVLALLVLALLAFSLATRWWDDLWDWLPWSTEQQLERAETRADDRRGRCQRPPHRGDLAGETTG